MTDTEISEGSILTGVIFNEPMRVVTTRRSGPEGVIAGLVGQNSGQFREVTLTKEDINSLTTIAAKASYDGDAELLRLAVQAYSLGIAHEFDPYFGLSISRVDPLPHQLEAVYEYFMKLPTVRFLLADDAGAGKTIMAGLLIRELKLRGLADRILVVCPANLTFQWQRELLEKFDQQFFVMRGGDVHNQFGMNQWLDHNQIVTSLDLAKRDDILPSLEQAPWDLVIVDEAHRMSASDESHKSLRYRLGEKLRDSTDNILLLTATPHKGDPANFTLFLQLLDQDAYADVTSIHKAMEERQAPFYLRRTKEAMGTFPRGPGGRDMGSAAGIHPTHPAHGQLRDRRRRAGSLQPGNGLRQTSELQGLRDGGRPEGSGRRVPDGPVPETAGIQHPRHAALLAKQSQSAAGRIETGTGPGQPRPTSPTGPGRPGRDGGQRP